jgi:hypothetical protein
MLRLERTEASLIILQFISRQWPLNLPPSNLYRPRKSFLCGGELELDPFCQSRPRARLRFVKTGCMPLHLSACWRGLGQPTAKIDILVVLQPLLLVPVLFLLFARG